MKKLLIFLLLLLFKTSFGQTDNKRNCRIEFYLLKSIKPNLDTSIRGVGSFKAEINDLADTAFVRDEEILQYVYDNDTLNFMGNTLRHNTLTFYLVDTAKKKINDLKISIYRGRQFALVVNKRIIYSGCFWDLNSSFWPVDGPMAVIHEAQIDIHLGTIIYNDFCN